MFKHHYYKVEPHIQGLVFTNESQNRHNLLMEIMKNKVKVGLKVYSEPADSLIRFLLNPVHLSLYNHLSLTENNSFLLHRVL